MTAISGGAYLETFDHGAGGWVANRYDPLPVWDGVAYCYGPWYLDSNHAPPGAGYLHLLMYLYTSKDLPKDHLGRIANRFIEQEKSTDLTDAKLTVRLRGQMDFQGSQLLLLVQAHTGETTANSAYVLSGQPLRIERAWSEQTLTLNADSTQWTCLGARWDLTDRYGCADLGSVLKDVNVNIMFVLFPLKIVPAGNVSEPHRLYPSPGPGEKPPGVKFPPSESYEIKREFLPKGIVMVDWVKIEYSG
ncbi:MAG: hypothetical protein L0387_07345 [Acidobacteria bacterium]|nr:hypothetical protein [Acidobacteriota bacterium]MCI0720944.1 hypothetical protein [Acidobacteriota bacterium]